jgi:hypothetical protein
MKITAYKNVPEAMPLVPASRKRKWMDETINQYAYRCLPLQIANASGWELQSPSDLLITWNGGNRKEDLEVHIAKATYDFASSTFGYGIVTFHPGYLFKTDEQYDLHITGSPNYFFEFMSPLTGIVENWWLPFTFTMNWKLNRPGTHIVKKGEPLCFLMPIPHEFPTMQAEMVDMDDHKDVWQEYDRWKKDRNEMIKALEHISKTGQPYKNVDPSVPASQWEKTYFRGERKDGKRQDDHITKRRFPVFQDNTKKPSGK